MSTRDPQRRRPGRTTRVHAPPPELDEREREPRRGWWTPAFRAWLEAHTRGECPWELDQLDELAQLAGDELVAQPRQVQRVAAAALAVSLAVDERRWRSAHAFVDELLAAVDELGDTDASR